MKQKVIAICGVKNVGKTTLIEQLIPIFNEMGLCVAVIKHDGHEFVGDVLGTDTDRHKKAGAVGTVVFSDTKILLHKNQKNSTVGQMMEFFPDANLILLEGGKKTSYPKIEIIREKLGQDSVCNKEGLLAYYTDVSLGFKPCFAFDQIEALAQMIYHHLELE